LALRLSRQFLELLLIVAAVNDARVHMGGGFQSWSGGWFRGTLFCHAPKLEKLPDAVNAAQPFEPAHKSRFPAPQTRGSFFPFAFGKAKAKRPVALCGRNPVAKSGHCRRSSPLEMDFNRRKQREQRS